MSHGLAPRPTLSDEELAAVVAAAEVLLKDRRFQPAPPAPTWRFSGRWWHEGPLVGRRPFN